MVVWAGYSVFPDFSLYARICNKAPPGSQNVQIMTCDSSDGCGFLSCEPE